MTETLTTSIKAINNWFYFCMNYPYNFIEKVWGPREKFNLTDHLQGKFDALYERYGSRAVMTAFYAELDGGNRKKLLTWVNENGRDFTTGLGKFEEED